MASPEARDPLLDEALVDASFQKRAQTVGLGIDNVESHRQVSFQPDPLLPAHTNTAAQKEIDGVEDSGNERRPFGHSWSSTPLFPIFGADAEHERLQEGTASSTFLLSEPESMVTALPLNPSRCCTLLIANRRPPRSRLRL